MTIVKEQKINTLLKSWPLGAVFLSSWLKENSISNQLLNSYRQNHWLESIGKGAVIRSGSKISYYGGLYALQKQAGLSIHIGGRTALSLWGKAHYLELDSKQVVLFGFKGEKLPIWFKNYKWGLKLNYYETKFLPAKLGLVNIKLDQLSLQISSPARAIMECLRLTPYEQNIIECYELMESLNNLNPKDVQKLLEECASVKVKRLFMYLAEKSNHDWFNLLNIKKINMGSGKRSFVKNGSYIDKYKITVPKQLEKDENSL